MGIDPGLTGALAVVDSKEAEYFQLKPKKINKKDHFDTEKFIEIYNYFLDKYSIDIILIEQVHTMPNQGVVSSGKFMKTVGIIEGVVSYSGLPYTLVSPRKWKPYTMKNYDKTDKTESIRFAQKYYPQLEFKYKYLHNAADAILIAHYGILTLN